MSPKQQHGTAKLHDGLIWAGSAFGSVFLSSLNPVLLFGLSDQSGSSLTCPPSSVPEPHSHPSGQQPASTSHSNQESHHVSSELVPKEHIAAAEAIILWRDPWRSIRVFGLGLYLFLCTHQLLLGSLLVQPFTLCLVIAFLYLASNVVRKMRARAPAAVMEDREAHSVEDEEIRVYFAVQNVLQTISSWMIPSLASTAVLIHRALSGCHLVSDLNWNRV